MALLKCVLCNEGATVVKVLPCLHLLCEKCASDYFDKAHKHSSVSVTNIIPCPSCGIKIRVSKSGVVTFKTYSCNSFNGEACDKTVQQPNKSSKSDSIDKHSDTDTSASLLVQIEKPDSDSINGSQTKKYDVQKFSCVAEQTDEDISIKLMWKDNTITDATLNGNTKINNSHTSSPPAGTEINEQDCNSSESGDFENNAVGLDETLVNLNRIVQGKKDYISQLLADMQKSMVTKSEQIQHLGILVAQLENVKQDLGYELEKRTAYLCELIRKRNKNLQKEISDICDTQLRKYKVNQDKIKKQRDLHHDAIVFSESVLKNNKHDIVLSFHNEISGRLLDLLHNYKSSIEIFSIILGTPDRGKEELHLKKLFGQFLSGSINCGTVELVSSFNIELSWPSSLITTKLNDFVIVGKTGAFETRGRVMLCDCNGQLKGNHIYPEDTVPFDAVSLQDGNILVSDNHGHITRFSVTGNMLDVWKNKFKGSGKMAKTLNNEVVITSSEEQCIYKYSHTGELLCKYPKSLPSKADAEVFQHPHGVAIDSKNNLVIADYQQNCVVWMDPNGCVLQKYHGCVSSNVKLRCPSAVCCDPFDNVLVADFTNDSVHLVSSTGQFLGYLLTKDNEMSCPNFLTLDADGLLFVGQYGGQIQVFRYLSCARQA